MGTEAGASIVKVIITGQEQSLKRGHQEALMCRCLKYIEIQNVLKKSTIAQYTYFSPSVNIREEDGNMMLWTVHGWNMVLNRYCNIKNDKIKYAYMKFMIYSKHVFGLMHVFLL